jgi:hypothetical protein
MARGDATQANAALADLIFLEGLPMRLVQSKYLQRFIDVASKVSGYKLPAYNTLRGKLLDEAVARTERQVQPWHDRACSTGCTVCSDGWSDANNRPLLNVLAVNPKGPCFLTAVNTQGHQKTAEYIAAQLFDAIEELGPENVVLVSSLRVHRSSCIFPCNACWRASAFPHRSVLRPTGCAAMSKVASPVHCSWQSHAAGPPNQFTEWASAPFAGCR